MYYRLEGIEGIVISINNRKWRLTYCDNECWIYYVVYEDKVYTMEYSTKEIINNIEEIVWHCKFLRDLEPMELVVEAVKINGELVTFWN